MTSISTKHRSNIFSVKFLPGTNDSLIASGAADRAILVYDLNKQSCLNELYIHQNRVKKIVTANNEPFLFWSCGEDGLILLVF
jgi:WD and tetratricopeptide repeat-containing protein 1